MTNPGNGGGVHVGGDGNSVITRTSVSNNSAGSEGGGLWNNVGTMTIRGVILNGNIALGATAAEGGGGVYNNGGILRVNPDTRITNNTATGASVVVVVF